MSYWKCLLIVLAAVVALCALVGVFTWLDDISDGRAFTVVSIVTVGLVIASIAGLLWAMING